jgi:signal transduction histidine kinase
MTIEEAHPERKQTDEGLAVEREKTDLALGEKRAAVEQTADGVLQRARGKADAVLTAARAKADDTLGRPASRRDAQAAIDRERALEDRALSEERAAADATLEAGRERAATLARLFPLERDKTDLLLLTERARSDDALANRDDFLGMVSHDLRDLLNGIVGSAGAIADNAGKDERGAASLVAAQRIQRSSARMARLISDLVDIASIDAGKLAIVPNVVDVAGLVLEAVETWAPPASSKGIILESVVGVPVWANVDSQRILQILGNLITNAAKFSARGARVVVALEAVDGKARFSVTDAGVGIAQGKLQAIFERFWQVGENDRRGMGLGLYISKYLVDAHGGQIWAESELGSGSTFFFTVAIAD